MTSRKVVHIARMAPGATCSVKELKSTSPVSLICELEMIKMLGGSPMPVAVPPMLEKICVCVSQYIYIYIYIYQYIRS